MIYEYWRLEKLFGGLENKQTPFRLAGISEDNPLGWKIVLNISQLPSKLCFSANCLFFGQSISLQNYPPIYQPPKGVYLLITFEISGQLWFWKTEYMTSSLNVRGVHAIYPHWVLGKTGSPRWRTGSPTRKINNTRITIYQWYLDGFLWCGVVKF